MTKVTSNTLYSLLLDGDRRTIGNINIAIELVQTHPSLIQSVVDGLELKSPVIRMRFADLAEKLSRNSPDILIPYLQTLIKLAKIEIQKEVRWHFARLLPRIISDKKSALVTYKILLTYLEDNSRITQVEAMTGLFELLLYLPDKTEDVHSIIQIALKNPAPSARARARKLMKLIAKSS